MEAFSLIVWVGYGVWTFEGNRTRGLSENDCKLRAGEVQPHQRR